MANRFRAAVKTTTFSVSEFAYESRQQGQAAIIQRVCTYDGMDVFLEETLDGVIDLPKIAAWVEKSSAGPLKLTEKAFLGGLLKKAEAKLNDMDLSVGGLVAKILIRFPDLVADLLADGAVLQDGETRDDFKDWLSSLTVVEVKDLCFQWYRFNLEETVRPLVEKAKAQAAAQGKAQAQPKPATGFRPVLA